MLLLNQFDLMNMRKDFSRKIEQGKSLKMDLLIVHVVIETKVSINGRIFPKENEPLNN